LARILGDVGTDTEELTGVRARCIWGEVSHLYPPGEGCGRRLGPFPEKKEFFT